MKKHQNIILSLSILATLTCSVLAQDAANSQPKPDNTQVNTRDQDNATLTPVDQGNSQEDLKMTSKIRKSVLANKSFSVDAANIKIITNKGHVTLRGPVKTEEEKMAIGKIALRFAKANNVDNQLEVSHS